MHTGHEGSGHLQTTQRNRIAELIGMIGGSIGIIGGIFGIISFFYAMRKDTLDFERDKGKVAVLSYNINVGKHVAVTPLHVSVRYKNFGNRTISNFRAQLFAMYVKNGYFTPANVMFNIPDVGQKLHTESSQEFVTLINSVEKIEPKDISGYIFKFMAVGFDEETGTYIEDVTDYFALRVDSNWNILQVSKPNIYAIRDIDSTFPYPIRHKLFLEE